MSTKKEEVVAAMSANNASYLASANESTSSAIYTGIHDVVIDDVYVQPAGPDVDGTLDAEGNVKIHDNCSIALLVQGVHTWEGEDSTNRTATIRLFDPKSDDPSLSDADNLKKSVSKSNRLFHILVNTIDMDEYEPFKDGKDLVTLESVSVQIQPLHTNQKDLRKVNTTLLSASKIYKQVEGQFPMFDDGVRVIPTAYLNKELFRVKLHEIFLKGSQGTFFDFAVELSALLAGRYVRLKFTANKDGKYSNLSNLYSGIAENVGLPVLMKYDPLKEGTRNLAEEAAATDAALLAAGDDFNTPADPEAVVNAGGLEL